MGLDLLIWFGPRLSLKGLINRLVDEIVFQSQLLPTESDTVEMLQTAQEMWTMMAEQFNLLVSLRSFPVGVPSIMTSILPERHPLGSPIQVEINSLLGVAGIFILLSLFGLVSGTLYFNLVSQAAVSNQVRWRQGLMDWPWSSVQVILLALFWFVVILGVSIPASCAISLATLGSIAFGQCGILLYGGLLVWIIFPLLFSAHGIFVNRKKVWVSIKQGVLIARLTLPVTTLFFLTLFLLSQGFNILWRIPPENSWLMLIGLAGHGFVSTGLLSSSFIYYRDADRWVMSLKKPDPPRGIINRDESQP
jgi:hypothetical protein